MLFDVDDFDLAILVILTRITQKTRSFKEMTCWLIEEVLTPAQKKDLLAKMTQALADVAGAGLRPAIWVRINEFGSGDWAGRGQAASNLGRASPCCREGDIGRPNGLGGPTHRDDHFSMCRT